VFRKPLTAAQVLALVAGMALAVLASVVVGGVVGNTGPLGDIPGILTGVIVITLVYNAVVKRMDRAA